MQNFGGEIVFTAGGTKIVVRGTVEVMPTNLEFEGAANQDGSVYRTANPVGYAANFTFEDMEADGWNDLYRRSPINVTVTETFTGKQHLFTEAAFTGRPTVNRKTGEVTGASIIALSYKKV